MSDRTVVLLLSDKRSGSTMLQRELCVHPAIQTVAYSPHSYLETHHWLKGAVILGLNAATFAGGKSYPGYGSRRNARTYLVDCVKHNVPSFELPVDDRALVFDGWEALCDRFAQPVFFEKSPQIIAQWAALSLVLEWMQQTRFRVKFIGLTRNPLAVTYSAQQLFYSNPYRRQFAWLESQKNMLAFQGLVPRDSFYAIRYEQIVEQPVDALAAICEFIGIDRNPVAGTAVHSTALNKWTQDPDFTLCLDPTVRQMAMKFGYTDAELENPAKPEPPLVHRMAGRWKSIRRLTVARLAYRFVRPFRLSQRQQSPSKSPQNE